MNALERVGWGLVIAGFACQFLAAFFLVANMVTPDQPLYSSRWTYSVGIGSLIGIVGGLFCVARAKQLNPALCLWGIFSVIGLYVFFGTIEENDGKPTSGRKPDAT